MTTVRIASDITGREITLRTELPVELILHDLIWQIACYLLAEYGEPDYPSDDGEFGDMLLYDPPLPPCDLAAALHIYEDGSILIRFHAIGDPLKAERAMISDPINL